MIADLIYYAWLGLGSTAALAWVALFTSRSLMDQLSAWLRAHRLYLDACDRLKDERTLAAAARLEIYRQENGERAEKVAAENA